MESVLDKLKIREIRPDDAEAITRIQHSITKTSPKIDFKPIIEKRLKDSDHVSFVAEVEGKVVGYMVSYIIYGGFGIEKSAWIATLGVDPRFMGQGIGKLLAQKIVETHKEKGITHLFTSVKWDSVDLLSFFKTLGFDRSEFINLRKELNP